MPCLSGLQKNEGAMKQQERNKAVERFWAVLDPSVKKSLHMGQRAEIENTLERLYPSRGGYSDVRFTLGKHFFVFLWGKERRSAKRQALESRANPVFAAKNLPIIAAVGSTIASICYVALHTSGRALMALMQ
jgi:hypothetical protein